MFFPSLVAYMSSGPVLALVIARDQAISYWRELIGPTNALKARQTHPDWYGHKSESRYSLCYYAYHCHFKFREHFCWIDLSVQLWIKMMYYKMIDNKAWWELLNLKQTLMHGRIVKSISIIYFVIDIYEIILVLI